MMKSNPFNLQFEVKKDITDQFAIRTLKRVIPDDVIPDVQIRYINLYCKLREKHPKDLAKDILAYCLLIFKFRLIRIEQTETLSKKDKRSIKIRKGWITSEIQSFNNTALKTKKEIMTKYYSEA